MAIGTLITDAQLLTGVSTGTPTPPASWLAVWVPQIEQAMLGWLNRPAFTYRAAYTEWFSPRDDDRLVLSLTPVEAVQSVMYDPTGGFGQTPGTFTPDCPSTTVMQPGADYYLALDAVDPKLQGPPVWSATGFLYRTGQTWPFSRFWRQDLIRYSKEQAPGTVKVTYSGGYTVSDDPAVQTIPGAVQLAVVQAACIWYVHLSNLGVTTSESEEGYSYGRALGATLSGEYLFSNVRGLLGQYKRLTPGGCHGVVP
jgi:hypothetical protein